MPRRGCLLVDFLGGDVRSPDTEGRNSKLFFGGLLPPVPSAPRKRVKESKRTNPSATDSDLNITPLKLDRMIQIVVWTILDFTLQSNARFRRRSVRGLSGRSS